MSEIRNLTRNGETFYPLTHVDAIVSNTGAGIDDVPTAGSDNPVKSGGVFKVTSGYGSSDRKLESLSIMPNVNIKDIINYSENYYWNHALKKVAVNSWCAIDPIRLFKGIPFYYRDIRGFFTSVLYDDGTIEHLAETDIKVSGVLTPSQDGIIFISSNTAEIDSVIITASQYIYNDIYNNAYGDYSEVNKIVLRDFKPSYKKIPVNVIKEWQNGFIRYDNGTLNISSNDWLKTTPYLRIENVKKFGISNYTYSFGFYDIDKNYIQTTLLNNSRHDYLEVDVPANAVFVRFSAEKAFMNEVYFCLGDGIHCPLEKIDVKKTLTDGADFTTIRKAVEYATLYNGVIIEIHEGEYDLCEEYATEIEEDHGHSAIYWYGIALKNDVHLIFSTGAKVNAYYQGSNVLETRKHFCPFNAQGGFVLENLWIEAGNSRYCVHDDYSGELSGTQHHKYLNCHMEYKTTEGDFCTCIGGGFAEYFNVEIVGCWFKTALAEDYGTPARIVSYHGSGSYQGECRVNVRDCYFSGWGTYATTAYGPSTKISISTVSGCSLGGEPYTRYETSDETTPFNVELISFNNEIRSHN